MIAFHGFILRHNGSKKESWRCGKIIDIVTANATFGIVANGAVASHSEIDYAGVLRNK